MLKMIYYWISFPASISTGNRYGSIPVLQAYGMCVQYGPHMWMLAGIGSAKENRHGVFNHPPADVKSTRPTSANISLEGLDTFSETKWAYGHASKRYLTLCTDGDMDRQTWTGGKTQWKRTLWLMPGQTLDKNASSFRFHRLLYCVMYHWLLPVNFTCSPLDDALSRRKWRRCKGEQNEREFSNDRLNCILLDGRPKFNVNWMALQCQARFWTVLSVSQLGRQAGLLQ